MKNTSHPDADERPEKDLEATVDDRSPMRGKPFQPRNKIGRGRPPGSRNKVTRARAVQELLDRYAEAVLKKCISMVGEGNPTALRLGVERILPVLRHRALHFKLPPVKTIADVDAASILVISAATQGKLTPPEGLAFSMMLEGRRRVIETQDLEQRIRALEDLDNASEPKRSLSLVGRKKQ